MRQVGRVLDEVNRALHYGAGALIIAVMALTIYNVLGRWLFAAGFRGTVELTQLAMIGIVYLGLAYAQSRDNHILVDLLYNRLGARTRIALDVFATTLGVIVLGLLAWQLYQYAGVLQAGNRVTGSRGIPLAPFAFVAITGVIAFLLAIIRTFVGRLRTHRQRSRDQPEDTRQAPL
jgi:TRAP-type C4-dicarboxylate transport system permease small subunit